MNLHEYQSKELLAKYGLPVPRGILAHTPGEAEAAADRLGGKLTVIKAQVHAGGRGKAGGVKLAKTPADARMYAEKILGMKLVTPQTGPKGKIVRKVLVSEGCDIAKEYYLSLLVDRASRNITVIASSEGGVEIEEVAHKHPEKIAKVTIDPTVGFQPFHGMKVGLLLGLDAAQAKKLSTIVAGLYKVFVECDCSLIEINPLITTPTGEFILLDAKCALDENALFRHPDLAALNDYDEMDPKDLVASKNGLSYIALEGNIGCMVNGAGLAMGTMDIIQQHGGSPANFLDVGGGATKEKVTEAFKIILQDDAVKAILVNIFGGIMKCDVIAQGVIEAARELQLKVPLVVRLQGTNVEIGRKLLAESGLRIEGADTMDEAAKKVVAAIRK